MIVTSTIAPLGLDAHRLSWTGTADRYVRVFVNGLLAYGPALVAEAEKSVDVALPSPGTVEVHENLPDETVGSTLVELARRPLVWWRTVAGASTYRIYVDDVVQAVVLNEPSRLHHETVLSADVRVDGGTWRELRVEAVSADGVETVSDPILVFVPGLPLEEPSAVEVSGGSGSFDVEIVP